jgi:pyruvate ferredoxin oxidoreductase delta subunit
MSQAIEKNGRTFVWDVTNFDNWTADEFPPGAVCPEAGNSALYYVGGWRSFKPAWDEEACTHCMLCWMHCPDSSIVVKDGKMTGIDYDHCKGCGICAIECRFKALEMVPESEKEE